MVGTSNSPAVWTTYPVPASSTARSGGSTNGAAWQFWSFTLKGINAFSASIVYMDLGFPLTYCTGNQVCQFTSFSAAYTFCEQAGLTRKDMQETVPYAGISPMVCIDDKNGKGQIAEQGACQLVNQKAVFASPSNSGGNVVTEFFSWNVYYWMCFTQVFTWNGYSTADAMIMGKNKAYVQSQNGFNYNGQFTTVCQVTGSKYSSNYNHRRLDDVIEEVVA
jgi:hypothetical protein